MIVAVALESLVKLFALICAGIFITYGLHDGIGDILHRAADAAFRESVGLAGAGEFPYLTWCTYLVLSMSAVLFLPRQFHVTVVENVRQAHIRTAVWLFPLYLVLINLFILPVAMGIISFAAVLHQYYPRPRAAALLDQAINKVHLDDKEQISILELADLYQEVERGLSGAVGAATAHMALKRAALFSSGETAALSGAYGEILAQLKITPDILKEKVQY
jgi:hypothetical protein